MDQRGERWETNHEKKKHETGERMEEERWWKREKWGRKGRGDEKLVGIENRCGEGGRGKAGGTALTQLLVVLWSYPGQISPDSYWNTAWLCSPPAVLQSLVTLQHRGGSDTETCSDLSCHITKVSNLVSSETGNVQSADYSVCGLYYSEHSAFCFFYLYVTVFMILKYCRW